MLTYAQNFEDVMLERLFREVDVGTYVDIGAWDPVTHSVTKHFYDRGWRGVNVEPIEHRWRLFNEQRPDDINLCVAVGAAWGTATFFECTTESYLSTLNPDVAGAMRARGLEVIDRTVDVMPLDDILRKHAPGTVEFLKVDVEGSEAEILKGLHLSKHRPRVLVIEATHPATSPEAIEQINEIGNWSLWEPRILGCGYSLAYFDGLNRFYLRDEDRELAARLALPPNVFDNALSYDLAEARRSNKTYAERFVEQSAMIETLFTAASERLVALDDLQRQLREKEQFVDQRAEVDALRADLAKRHVELSHAKAERDADVEALRMQIGEREAVAGALQAQLREREAELNNAMVLMWQARQRSRELEAELDQRRFGLWRHKLVKLARTEGRRYAEAALCQVFPPQDPRPRPSFSIVTPVMNNADTVRETIDSVLSQVGVTFEYIIVDGGSTDGTAEILDSYAHRATIVREPDQGMYDAIGKGFDRATGDVLAYLNADDVYEAGALARVADAFLRHPRRQVFFFEDSVTVCGWRFPNTAQKDVDLLSLFKGHILFQDGVFFSRRAYNFVGGVNRGMRLAGDWDLWVRLSRHFRFRRLRGHVSSFRVREGQLSQRMDAYFAEVEAARKGLRLSRLERAFSLPRHIANRVGNRLRHIARRVDRSRRLFFPIDFQQMPPPEGLTPPYTPNAPLSPVDRSHPTDLLFSSRDTRFGDPMISYLYYHRDEDVVSVYPPISREDLVSLYARTYNKRDPQLQLPAEGGTSPYRRFRAANPFQRRMAHLCFPRKVRAAAMRFGLIHWIDRSLEEIDIAVRGLLPRDDSSPHFLDVGCFDGKLLDRVAKERGWSACGVEPNAEAAQTARDKGHEVWNCEVEDILNAVPEDRRFDIIFLGQTIEHFNDPLEAVIRLSMLLKPGGVMVLSTPNLNSAQIDMFGPTWSHWHPPYHRHLFSPRSLRLLASRAGLAQVRCRTFSHPSWSWMSQKLHGLGLGAAVPHGIAIPAGDIPAAESLAILSRVLYDWRKRGDYIYATFKKPLD